MSAFVLATSFCLSVGGGLLTSWLIAEFIPIFIGRRLFGSDLCKKDKTQTAEPMGVVSATVYLMVMFLFTPVPFYGWLADDDSSFPHSRFVEFLSGLLSICCMIFLGFADDVLDLRWRHKLLLPSLASLPLLMVYAANVNSTTIIVPKQLEFLLGADLHLGFLYYVYMGMMAVFCTNAINILAGINGIEAAQSAVIASSVIIFNFIQLYRSETQSWYHQLSLYFLLPYLCTTLALLKYNWYPARVFVGDTFCYFSGMTFAVVGILGHFSKTLLLFFLPQIFNFLYSVPQLFHFIPCPRHRLPKFNPETNQVGMSVSRFKEKDLRLLGKVSMWLLETVGLLHVTRGLGEDKEFVEVNNLTILNLTLKFRGPMHERDLTKFLVAVQISASLIAFFIRFLMAGLVYDVVN